MPPFTVQHWSHITISLKNLNVILIMSSTFSNLQAWYLFYIFNKFLLQACNLNGIFNRILYKHVILMVHSTKSFYKLVTLMVYYIKQNPLQACNLNWTCRRPPPVATPSSFPTAHSTQNATAQAPHSTVVTSPTLSTISRRPRASSSRKQSHR